MRRNVRVWFGAPHAFGSLPFYLLLPQLAAPPTAAAIAAFLLSPPITTTFNENGNAPPCCARARMSVLLLRLLYLPFYTMLLLPRSAALKRFLLLNQTACHRLGFASLGAPLRRAPVWFSLCFATPPSTADVDHTPLNLDHLLTMH